MPVLQIAADRPGAGKTCLAGALLLHLAAAGKQAGYYKPFSDHPGEDPDVVFITQTLPNAASPWQVPAPVPPFTGAGPSLVSPAAEEVQHAVSTLQSGCDLLLLEGPDLETSTGQSSPLPLELSSLTDSKVLLLVRYAKDLRMADVERAAQSFGDRLAGVLINGVSRYRLREVNQSMEAALPPHGIAFWGALREDRSMIAVTVQQIADHLGGSWAQEPENIEAPVERFLIGGNIMDLGPTYFGRYANQAVIVRAGRPDIQMASLLPETRCLVLTGNEALTEYVKAEALQRGVPLISVESGTLETAQALGGILDQTPALTRRKIESFLQLLRCNLDLDALLALMD